LKTAQQVEILMKIFIGSNILALIISLPNFDFYVSQTLSDVNRLSGKVGNSNEFSIYVSVAILMLLYFFAQSTKKSEKIIILILSIIMTLFVMLSGSRGGILFLIPVMIWQMIRFSKKNLPLLVLIMVSLLFLSSLLPSAYVDRIKAIPQDIITQSDTVGLRYGLWQYAIQLWKQKPVFGIGTGVFVYYSDQSPILHGVRNLQAHNTYITYLAENGIVGLGFFLFIIFKSIFNFEKVKQFKEGLAVFKNLAVTWESILLVFLLNGIKGNLNMNKIMWFSFAISVVLITIASQSIIRFSPLEEHQSTSQIRKEDLNNKR
jgi:O-antigen ligase